MLAWVNSGSSCSETIGYYFKEKEVSITDCQELIKKSSVFLSPGFISKVGIFISKLPIFNPFSKWLLNAVWVQEKTDCVIQHNIYSPNIQLPSLQT